MMTSEVTINLNVFDALVKEQIVGNLNGILVIAMHES
jgi:hypothetical protein